MDAGNEVATWLGGQWFGDSEGNDWLSSAAAECDDGDDSSTWLSTVTKDSISSDCLWLSTSAEEDTWLTREEAREEGIEQETDGLISLCPAWTSQVEVRQAVKPAAAASITASVDVESAPKAVQMRGGGSSKKRVALTGPAAGSVTRGAAKKVAPARKASTCCAAMKDGTKAGAKKQLSKGSPAAEQPRRTPSPVHSTVPGYAREVAGRQTERKERAAVRVKKELHGNVDAIERKTSQPLTRSHSLPCPPCHVGGIRMEHGSRSPELLSTASQAAKVAAIVKGGRGKAVSEEERARSEAWRERAAAALRDSHKWERERWTSGAECVRMSILRKSKSI